MVGHFVNLSHGRAWEPMLAGYDWSYVRIESSRLEAKDWNGVLLRLGADFLHALASDPEGVVVYDCSSRKPVGRAIFQGVPWIGYACCRAWQVLDWTPYAQVRNQPVSDYWAHCWRHLPHSTRQMLRYYRRFRMEGSPVLIRGECFQLKEP